jgi:hypothetical protein
MPQTSLLSTTDRNCRPIWHRFQPRGVKSTPYTAHIHSTNIKLAPFEFCDRIFGQWPTIKKIPIPLPHLYVYLHIIDTHTQTFFYIEDMFFSIFCCERALSFFSGVVNTCESEFPERPLDMIEADALLSFASPENLIILRHREGTR